MGFISSGNTSIVIAYLTQTGREYLFQGDKSLFIVKYFTLGDSDTNYKISNSLGLGFVPDIAGNDGECLPSITQNIDIKNKITQD